MPMLTKRSLATLSRAILRSLVAGFLLAEPLLWAVTPLGTIKVGEFPSTKRDPPALPGRQ